MVLPGYINAAASQGAASDLETIQDWFDNGGAIDDVDSEGFTILTMSILFESIEVLKWAISRGASVNNIGDPPLFTTIAADSKEFILDAASVLLDAGAHINAATSARTYGSYIAGETALSYAIDWLRRDSDDDAEKALACVSLLLRRGARLARAPHGSAGRL